MAPSARHRKGYAPNLDGRHRRNRTVSITSARAGCVTGRDAILEKQALKTTKPKIDVVPSDRHPFRSNQLKENNMTNWQPIVDRAGKDSSFRNRLKSDPVAAGLEMGVSIPEGTTIDIIEPSGDHREMSELELESVSGGGALKNLALRIGNALCRDSSSSEYTQDEPGGFITGITVTVNNSFNSTVTVY